MPWIRPFSMGVVLLVAGLPVIAHAQGRAEAMALLRQAAAAQGGEQALRALRNVRWQMAGYRDMVEESERPEGPYLKEFDSVTEVDDLEHHRFRSITQADVHPVFNFSQGTLATAAIEMNFANGEWRPGRPQQLRVAQEQLALSPERLLITAMDATDTHLLPDTVLHTEAQRSITFTLDGAPAVVYLDAHTFLPTAVDYSGPLAGTGFFRFTGDATQRTWYNLWWLAKGGIHLPLEWTIERNGLPDRMLVAQVVDIDYPIDEKDFAISAGALDTFRNAKDISPELLPLGNPQDPEQQIAPDIYFIPGAWNVSIIRQDDGVVILEAPISSGYSAKVIDEAHRLFPNDAIKAVITTSDSWPHLAGVREYVARGIPVYALGLDKPILERTLLAPHTHEPDSLQKTPRAADFHLVGDRLELASKKNPIQLLPLRGPTTFRQLMVYFPQQRLLYCSDAFQINPDGTYNLPQTVSEVLDAAKREHLDVTRYYAMHVPPSAWETLQPVVDAARKTDSPHEAR